jgi:hypothetical protein
VTVADSTLPGARTAGAACDHLDGNPLFGDPLVDVQVSTWRRLGVTPMTHAGRIASLEVRGIGVCPRDPPPGLVELGFHPPGEDPSIPGGILPAATADPDGTGHWSGTIPVPATAEPGRYVLSASCTYSRAETAWYTGDRVTIG